jgi:hypothetical protein
VGGVPGRAEALGGSELLFELRSMRPVGAATRGPPIRATAARSVRTDRAVDVRSGPENTDFTVLTTEPTAFLIPSSTLLYQGVAVACRAEAVVCAVLVLWETSARSASTVRAVDTRFELWTGGLNIGLGRTTGARSKTDRTLLAAELMALLIWRSGFLSAPLAGEVWRPPPPAPSMFTIVLPPGGARRRPSS